MSRAGEMSRADDLTDRYADALRGFGASLPEDFSAAARSLQEPLSAEQLERWAETGIALAHQSLRSWEAAAEYFRASPRLGRSLSFQELMDWAALATVLAQRSSVLAAAFLKATPEALESLRPDQTEAWARQGERLYRDNWKSIALASLYFSASPRLMDLLTLSQLDRLVDVVEALTERSYELATTCLAGAASIFATLEPRDRDPFMEFAHAVTRASWADARLYFERGPALLDQIHPEHRGRFLELAVQVTGAIGRQGFPLFADAAAALGETDSADHAGLMDFAGELVGGSPTAAMEYLKSAPYVRNRLTPEEMRNWARVGADLLLEDGNVEGAEAFFRLESTRAEELLARLSARVELSRVGSTLRLYAKALTGEQVSVRSTEELVEKGIGWISESTATTEGTTIYLPPFVDTFEEQTENFQAYKVIATHQTGRMEFGSFRFRFGVDGAHVASTVETRERELRGDQPVTAVTSMERYFDLFPARMLIAGLFTIVEDTRIDALVAREYAGIRSSLRRLQAVEAARRPEVREMGLRQAFVENLLRASLDQPETVLWPADVGDDLDPLLRDGLAALRLVEREQATIQDSAEVAAALYDLAARIPNIRLRSEAGAWETPPEETIAVPPGMPDEDQGQPIIQGDEEGFENPPQPEFRGDFKPELVQLLMQLRLEEGGQSDLPPSPITKEQLEELLEKSAEIAISELEEGDLASSLRLLLDNLEKEAGTPQSEGRLTDGDDMSVGDERDPDPEEPTVEIEWFQYDEWDFRAADYRPRWTRVGQRPAAEGELDYYEETLRRHHGLVMETRRQFEQLRPEMFRKMRRMEDGEGIDIDRALEFLVDKRAGSGPQARFYWRRNKVERDVAVAFLLDMSASTDEEIEKQRLAYEEEEFDRDPSKYFEWLAARRAHQSRESPQRIIDLEKEATVLIVEALEAIGDAYGIFGFSGYGRENVEYHVIKGLDEPFGDRVRRRIDKIEPIRSTRMGPAIRHTIHQLQEYDAKVKILILVSDGRPQDHGYGRDRTEREYAVHDTKQALLEAKRAGVTPFLITVDKEGHDYLREMCDDIGYEVVADIESLPRRLPSLYRALATQ